MKTIIQTFLPTLVIATMTGCASTKAYFVDRGRDAADILTATAGTGLGGVKVKAGPLAIGAYQSSDTIGIRGGEAFAFPDNRHAGWDAWFPFPIIPVDWGDMAGVEMWHGDGRSFERGKSIGYLSPFPFWIGGLGERGWRSPYPYQVDAAIGLGVTFRVGVNPVEFLDFILGWFGIDIFGDDIEAKKPKEKSNQSSEATPKPGAPQ